MKDLTRNEIRAARALDRLLNDYLTSDEDYHREAAFDGGEWSGPALAAFDEAETDRLTHMCAERHGLTHAEMDHAIGYRVNEEMHRMFDARGIA